MGSKIGLVLGGGGSRGLAHIGVLQVLARENIGFDFIVGTSMGGIVGALYSRGFSLEHIGERLNELGGGSIFGWRLFSARARQRMVRDTLAEVFDGLTFEDLHIPLTVMAVDMKHGQEIALDSGPLIPALLASSAVPAIFPPVELDGLQLVDGGVIDSLATHVAYRLRADLIIGVDVYPSLEPDDLWQDPLSDIMGFPSPFGLFRNDMPSMLAATWRAVRVMTWHLHQERLERHPPHILMRPSIREYSSLDFRDVQGPILAGANEAERHLAEIKAVVEDMRSASIEMESE